MTMLFADVQGPTSLAERLDPGDWADIMNGAFEKLITAIYRYEGTLTQFEATPYWPSSGTDRTRRELPWK